jgi:hypothetical protein
VSDTSKNDDDRLDELRKSLESLRAHIMDLDAMAHAAADTLDHIPFLPRPSRTQSRARPAWTDEERRNFGRMQSLVLATASAAESALGEINELIEETYSDRGPRGGGVSGAPGGHGSAPSEPDASNGGQGAPSRTGAPTGAQDQPRDPGFRSLPGGVVLDMRPIPPRPA